MKYYLVVVIAPHAKDSSYNICADTAVAAV